MAPTGVPPPLSEGVVEVVLNGLVDVDEELVVELLLLRGGVVVVSSTAASGEG